MNKVMDNNVRTCVATREKLDKSQMLRFAVLEEDGIVVPDFNKKLVSRGVYVIASKKALQTAVDKQLFLRSLKKKVKHEKNMCDVVENLLKKQGLNTISMAKKAGALIVGLDNIKKEKESICLFIETTSKDSDGYKKVKAMAKDKPVFCLYNLEELEQALSLSNCAHIAIKHGQMGKNVCDILYKLKNFLEN